MRDDVMINDQVINHLYRYTGFIDIGNHNETLTSEWLISEEIPDVKLYESVYERLWGGIIEKVSITVPYELGTDNLWINEDEVCFWVNDSNRMETDPEGVKQEILQRFLHKTLTPQIPDEEPDWKGGAPNYDKFKGTPPEEVLIMFNID